MDLDILIKEATASMKMSIANYSKFKVGAALVGKSGKIYTGCNIESITGALSTCAERLAIMKALSEGERFFKAIVIVSSKGDYCFPCGTCRQILIENAPDCEIYIVSDKGIKKFMPYELLPHPFVRK